MQTATENKPTYDELIAENQFLRNEIASLKRLIFGQKRERYVPIESPDQLAFFKTEPKETSENIFENISYTRKKRSKQQTPHSRKPLPSHLPRKEIVIEQEEDTTEMKKIGEEITEELEYKPGTLYVNRYIRPKYALPEDEGVIIGSLPSRPIEKGIAGPGLLAHILISKYVDHLPLYRQGKQFKRQGIELSKSTLYGWVKASSELLVPLHEAQKSQVLESDYIMADETPIRVLDPDLKPGRTHQGYYWVYYAPLKGAVFFDYRETRSRAGPNEILKDFEGYLQADGYTGYDEISQKKKVTAVGCMAHARRHFVESKDSDKERSEWMLSTIQELYDIERDAREGNLSSDERYQLRQEKAVPILKSIKDWLDKESIKVLPKSVVGKAIGYMLNQWSRLKEYVTDGRLEIDNNLVENAIRPVALGRKNYLFAGSHEGANRAAMIYSFVANAQLQGVEPFAYLRDVLDRISDYPHKQINDLLACNWEIPSLE